MSRAPVLRFLRHPGFALSGLAAASLAACVPERTSGPGTLETEEGRPAAFAWVGTWSGRASGLLGESTVDGASIDLTITFSQTGEAPPGCALCVTVVLGDTLFVLRGIELGDPVTLTLAYARADTVRSLDLTRWSAGGPGNAMTGDFVLEVGPPGAVVTRADLALALDRR